MPIIVEPKKTSGEALVAALPSGALLLHDLDALAEVLPQSPDEYAVVLGAGVDEAGATSFANQIRLTRPATSVILVRHQVSTTLLTSAMHAGIREVVEEGDGAALAAAVDRARQVWAAIQTPTGGDPAVGRVITVFSPKGGVGKTTTAVNLAVALVDGGARRVCLVDLDLSFGDVAITLQLFPQHTIFEAVPVEEHLDFAMLETLLTKQEDGLRVLAAPTQPDAKDRIGGPLISKVIDILRNNFDFVVIDTAPSFDEQVLQAFDETDDCLLVATLDVPTLKNVKIAIDTLNLLNVAEGRRWLVLNRADEQVGIGPDKVESILGMPISVSLPTALEVASATNAGHPIVLSNPNHPVSLGLRALARVLAGGSEPKVVVPAGGRRRAQRNKSFAWQRK